MSSSAVDRFVADTLGLNRETDLPLSDLSAPLITTALFAATIVILKKYMASNPSFNPDTKFISKVHNYILCAISFVMFVASFFYLFSKNDTGSAKGIFCNSTTTPLPTELHFWLYVYYLTKFYEYLDTVILVLNRRPLIFLHVYHHMIVPFMVWTWIRSDNILSAHGIIYNAGVHTLMYYYYASNNRNLFFKRLVTQLQIIQFISSFILGLVHFVYHMTTDGCNSFHVFLYAALINASFLTLFLNFFRSTYGKKRVPRPASAVPSKDADPKTDEDTTAKTGDTATATAVPTATASTTETAKLRK
eukprot:TRINITY_DN6121_c0_g1_i1.p1 TRINITY_DN6121_c0_g1~~TRINITY_DN6121_c0_g1_i1.p1  ORF type:complete len:304 (+),score=140.88 TRINITY_DN6121_c0_g1_i1:246-1157(+)